MPVLNFAKALRLGGQVVTAVHLDRHRVYPPPPPYLEPPVGIVSTPDAAEFTMSDPVRLTMKVRSAILAGSADMFASGQWGATGEWYLGARGAGWVFGRNDDKGVRYDFTAMNLTELRAVLPTGADSYIGVLVEPRGSAPGVSGIASVDGTTWTVVRKAPPPAGAWDPRDSTSPLTVGSHGTPPAWNGRIYWMQAEAINRAQLWLPGVPGNLLTVPDSAALSVTGDIEIVARLSRPDWAATYAHIVGKDWSPRGWLLRVAFSTLNFVVPTPDGSAQNSVNSANLGGVNGQPLWIRVSRVAATGAVAFYSAPDQPTEPTVWTARGTGSTPAGPLPVSVGPVQIGARGLAGIEPWQGRIARVIIRDAIGAGAQFVFPGTTGTYLSVPNAAALQITGDTEHVFRASADAWSGTTHRLLTKDNVSTPRGWIMGILGDGRLNVSYADPTGLLIGGNSVGLPIAAPGTMQWLKVTFNRTTGVIAFYSAADSPTEPTTWTARGTTTVVTGAGAVNTLPVLIGDRPVGGAEAWQGRIARTIIRNGIGGTVVLDVDEIAATGYASTFRATTGQTVTEIGNVIRGRVLDARENDAWTATAPSRPYLNPGVGSVYANDAPDLTITGDIRVTAYLRDDSVESAGSRYWVAKFAAPSDYAYSFLATYLTYQYASQGWPTGAATPAGSLIMGSRTQFGTTPPGADVYLRADVTGVNPNSQALTNTAKGYTSTDGVAWTPAGTPPSPLVRADALCRDAVTRLRLGSGALGRLYWVQVENINRARLMFPGVTGNYLSTPDAPALDVTGPLEIVVRATLDWQSATSSAWLVSKYASGQRSYGLLMEGTYPGRPRLLRSIDGTSTADTATSTTAVPLANGQTGWVKVTHDAAGTTRFWWAPDAGTNVEPTTWTQVGGDRAGYNPATFAGTAPVWIGDAPQAAPGAFPGAAKGRIARTIIRSAGTVVLDVAENDAGTMGAATTFPATTGQTMTVAQTAGNTIVQPQPDVLVWRFDAAEVPAGAAAYTDPRGRAWSIEPAGSVVASSAFVASSGQPVTAYSTPGAAEIVQRQPDSTIWRFDANDWPPAAASIVGADGRVWTATSPAAVAHPASQPD